MQKLIVTGLVLLTAVGGTHQYLKYRSAQDARQQAQARFEMDKKALEQAIAKNSLPALNQYIFDHPDSQWLDNARYHRDKLLYHEAADSGKTAALRQFIKEHPQSSWLQHAELALQRLQNLERYQAELERKQAELEARRASHHPEPEESNESDQPTATEESKPPAAASASSAAKSADRKSGTSSRERIERALSIYEKQRQQEQKARFQRNEERKHQEEERHQCLLLKDQIDQFGKHRGHWYELDENGERVFLSESQVKDRRKELQQQYQTHCN